MTWDDQRKYKNILGMKQRLGIGGSCCGKPDLVYFDEPFMQLDTSGIEMVSSFAERKEKWSIGDILLS